MNAVVSAEAVVSRNPTSEIGMVARANELHRAGVVDQCVELFRIVAQLKDEVMRKRETTWSAYVAKNFSFKLATADNYARIGRSPNALGAGPVRRLHASGRPGYRKPEKPATAIKSEPDIVDAEVIETQVAPDAGLEDLHVTAAKTIATLDAQIAREDGTTVLKSISAQFDDIAARIPYAPGSKGPASCYRWADASPLMRLLALESAKKNTHGRVFDVVMLADLLGVSKQFEEQVKMKITQAREAPE